MNQAPRKKICFAATVPYAVRAFLLDHARCLAASYDVTVVTNLQDDEFKDVASEHIHFINIPFCREPAPLRDLKCLVGLMRLFKKEGFASIHSITPKAGLLAMLAAWLTGVKVRLHTFTGQVWATRSGLARFALKIFDCFFAGLATHVFVDSASQRDFLIKEGVIREDRSKVLGSGSISGVDTVRFAPNANLRQKTRSELGFSPNETIFLFLGRLKRDKGILTLAEAYGTVSREWPNARLLIVGPDEEGLRDHPVFHGSEAPVVFAGHTPEPEKYMNAADVFCLPSRREGFGQVIIEAACTGIPAIASRIYGITDAVTDGETGLLHAPDNVEELAGCMKRLMKDPDLRITLGSAARTRAVAEFPKERLTEALREAYRRLLDQKP